MSTVIETPAPERKHSSRSDQATTSSAFTPRQLVAALPGALRKLDPRQMWRNPVMFIVEIGAAYTTLIAIAEPFLGGAAKSGGALVPASFTWGIAIWLWLTVVFANLAEAVAEGRGKAQAESLRQTRTSTMANRVVSYDERNDAGAEEASTSPVSSADLTLGDVVVKLRVSWYPAMATSSGASPRSTSLPSRESRLPSSVNRAETGVR